MTREEVRDAYFALVQSFGHHRIRINGSRLGVTVQRRPRWGLPGPAVLIPRSDDDAAVSLGPVRAAAEAAMERRVRKAGDNGPSLGMRDEQSEKRWPLLWDHLTSVTYSDGTPRLCSSLLIFEQEGSLKGMLRDKNEVECLWQSARGLLPLLDVLEVELSSDDPDWRPDRKAGGERAPRRKAG